MGMVNGIKNAAGAYVNAAKNVASSAINAVRSVLNSHSPSRVMMGMVEILEKVSKSVLMIKEISCKHCRRFGIQCNKSS